MAVRTIDVRERVMARNDELAAVVRERLRGSGVVALNLVSSPGSGKTALLERTLDAVGEELDIAVVTGDVQTQNDADRLARRTSRLVQAVVTGGACHLDARQVLTALDALDLDHTRLLFIENVGNLVCPASWDLGEEAKVVVFSVTEGEDKPLKYPKMFREASYAVLNKIDLLPYVPFDVDRALTYAREVNPALRFFLTSALTGEGLTEWFEFLRQCCGATRPG
jgi:hydrogenase nickel incorporation protein HypB